MKMKQSDIAKVKKLLLETQKACLLCDSSFSKMLPSNICLDHCHQTGYIRGLLCRNCNGNLGRLEGLATRSKKQLTMRGWLKNAVDFLELHKVPQTEWVHPKFKTPLEKRVANAAAAMKKRIAKKGGSNV